MKQTQRFSPICLKCGSHQTMDMAQPLQTKQIDYHQDYSILLLFNLRYLMKKRNGFLKNYINVIF